MIQIDEDRLSEATLMAIGCDYKLRIETGMTVDENKEKVKEVLWHKEDFNKKINYISEITTILDLLDKDQCEKVLTYIDSYIVKEHYPSFGINKTEK